MNILYHCVVSSLGFSQSGVGGTLGSSLPPFQTSMSPSLGQMGTGPAMDTQKGSGPFGVENKTMSSTSGSSTVKSSDVVSSGGPGTLTQDHPPGIKTYGREWQHCCWQPFDSLTCLHRYLLKVHTSLKSRQKEPDKKKENGFHTGIIQGILQSPGRVILVNICRHHFCVLRNTLMSKGTLSIF